MSTSLKDRAGYCLNACVSQRVVSVVQEAPPLSRGQCLTCGAQTVIQQVRGQEARGAGGVRGQTCCLPATCRPCAYRRGTGRIEHPKSVLPLFAELIAPPRTWAQEVFEERHVALLTVFFVCSEPCRAGQTIREQTTTWGRVGEREEGAVYQTRQLIVKMCVSSSVTVQDLAATQTVKKTLN